MKSNTKGNRIDRLRMHELFLEHGGSRAAAKKIAGELGCNWQTVLRAIKDEGWQDAREVDVTPTVVTHITPGDGPIPTLKIGAGDANPEETQTNSARRTFMCNFVPDSDFSRTVEEIEADIESEKIKVDGMKAASAMGKTSDIDAAYFAALDCLAEAYTNESEVKKDIRLALLVDGLQGLETKLHEALDFLQSALSNEEKAKPCELAFGLQTIANMSVQGLMFLSSLEDE